MAKLLMLQCKTRKGGRRLFPSSQRRGGYAEQSEGVDGVVGSAKCHGRPDHPSALRHPSPATPARRRMHLRNLNSSIVCPFNAAKRHDCSVVRREILPRDGANIVG